MKTVLLVAVLFLSLLYLLKGESNVPSTFTCSVTCPKCECDNVGYESCNTTAIESLINQVTELTKTNAKSIYKNKKLLSKLQNNSYTSGAVLNDLLLLVEELVTMHNVSTTALSPLPKSCQEIKQRMSTSPSGVYLIATVTNQTDYVYCNMETMCGAEGGWTRLAYLDMTDTTESCPNGWKLHEEDGVRACGRADSGGASSCNSVQYPSNGVRYTEICGRARGYQYSRTGAIGMSNNDINSHYVDGLSLTRGNPRKHIWTFMAGAKEDNSLDQGTYMYACPCQTGSQQANVIPSFIGNDYYCESGNPSTPTGFHYKLYTADPLWDGEQCNGLESTCCTSTTLPWFHKVLDSPTNDYIEARVCADFDILSEDTPIDILEIYVK